METQDLRTLKILEEIDNDHTPSQRELAQKLDISLGLVNSFIKRLVNKGYFKGARVLSPLTVNRMTSTYPRVQFSGRGLGWDLDSSYSTNGGDIFGPRSFGHTGYTGTSIWIDPDTEIFIIFLTNRAHPHDKGAIVPLRSKIANIVASSIR